MFEESVLKGYKKKQYLRIDILVTASYISQEYCWNKRIILTINTVIRTHSSHGNAHINSSAECLYAVFDAANGIVRLGCTYPSEKLLIGMKSSAAHVCTFGSKVFSRLSNKTKTAFEAKGKCKVLCGCFSFGQYWFMMKNDETIKWFLIVLSSKTNFFWELGELIIEWT